MPSVEGGVNYLRVPSPGGDGSEGANRTVLGSGTVIFANAFAPSVTTCRALHFIFLLSDAANDINKAYEPGARAGFAAF